MAAYCDHLCFDSTASKMSRLTLIILILQVVLICYKSTNGSLLQESIYNLGLKLFNHQLMEDRVTSVPNNIIVSPLGLGVGLGLVEAAASNDLSGIILDEFFETATERDLQRHLTRIQKAFKSGYKVNSTENITTGSEKDFSDTDDVTVNVQSAIFKQDNLTLKDTFKRLAVEGYDADIIALNKR